MDKILKRLKALADKNRLEIIKLLLTKNYCVSALAKRLDISESAVSQQLKILREADLVMGEKRGYYVHYLVKKENIQQISDYI
ncbi:MAG: ArsR/SmtB family transcription factor, partial [Bacillota bacterium]